MNKFKEYGFKRNFFEECACTGVKGESHKGIKYGYTKSIDIDDDLTITLNIIPVKDEWICEKIEFRRDIFNKILDYEIEDKDIEEFQHSKLSKFNFSMKQLNYEIKNYEKVNRWAYLETKENALKEMLFQYPYLFNN